MLRLRAGVLVFSSIPVSCWHLPAEINCSKASQCSILVCLTLQAERGAAAAVPLLRSWQEAHCHVLFGGVRKWQEIWAPKSLAGLNLPPLKGSVFPPKGVSPSTSETWPLLGCSHLASQTSPSLWQQCSGSCGTTWSQSCALYCKNCLGDTQRDV